MTGAVTEDATRPLPRQPGPDPATGPSRLPEARLEHVFERTADTTPGATAVEHEGRATSYADLDARANQLAHDLADRGVRPGARVALFLERSPETYVALLGALKAGAAFVPIDPESPADRVAYIADDAGVDLLLTSTALADTVARAGPRLARRRRRGRQLDAAAAHRPATAPDVAGDGRRPHRLRHLHVRLERAAQGRRGRAVEHLQLPRRRARPCTTCGPTDRVYQGMTIAFDFSIEEIWPTWAVGATLVAGPTDSRRLGAELADFLETRTASPSCTACRRCWRPSRATCPRSARVLVGGEACPRRARRALEPARAADPQHLRADRGDGHRDLVRAAAGPAGHHRPAAADLQRRSCSTSERQPVAPTARSARSASAGPAWRAATSGGPS